MRKAWRQFLPGQTARRWGAVSFASGVLVAAFSSCKVGPNYERPKLDMPATYKSAMTAPATEAATQTATGAAGHLGVDWWRLFEDPTLDRLETAALANNQDVRAAVGQVLAARAAAQITRSEFFPAVTADPSFTRARTSANLTKSGNGSGVTGNVIRAPIDMSYEIDVWGRVRRAYESSNAQLRASADDLQVIIQTMEADIAQDYFNLRSFDTQYDIVSQNVAAYDRQVQLLQTQQQAGVVGSLEVLQAQALRDTAVSTQEDLKRQRDRMEHAIAILTGRTPSELSVPATTFTLAPPVVPAGLPSELLRRRPDVAEAEQNVMAANANVGVATANFYPVFSLTGAAGFESVDLQHLFDWESHIWSIGPNVTVPLFAGGRLRGELEQSRQLYNQAVAAYRQQVLIAIQDVEDSLSDLRHYAGEARSVDVAVNSSSEYLRLSNIQYKNGIINYLTVIDAERTLLNNQITAEQIRNNRLISTVFLIKALGGGWDARHPAASVPVVPGYDPQAATRPAPGSWIGP
ncbi:MAG: efflux transporter outer membrane subunit [Phycisphaerae bacterium]